MRLSLIGLFLLKAIAWFVAWLLVWYALRDWVSIPVALLTKATVAMLFPSWAEGVEHAGPVLTLLTSPEVHGMAGVPLGQVESPRVSWRPLGLSQATGVASSASCL
jgi:hypothetical protein